MTRKQVVLTGDRPTGPLHLGHYAGSLQSRVRLQTSTTQFVMIADIQALTDYSDRAQVVRDSVYEVLLDYLAVGIDPNQTIVFVQSQVPALAELTVHLMNIVTMERVGRNPTVKNEIRERGYGENVTAGFFMYPVSQAADILAFKSDVIPVGADQLPMIELANELGRRFNKLFGAEVFRECEALIPSVGRLPGIDGKGKMGKSLKNAIYLSDSAYEVTRKVMKMYTDPGHVRVEDAGRVEGNVVFTYLDAFDENVEEIQALKAHYERGGLSDTALKRRLAAVLDRLLGPIRERRIRFAQDRAYLQEVLKDGTLRANEVASATLAEVRRAMGILYF